MFSQLVNVGFYVILVPAFVYFVSNSIFLPYLACLFAVTVLLLVLNAYSFLIFELKCCHVILIAQAALMTVMLTNQIHSVLI